MNSSNQTSNETGKSFVWKAVVLILFVLVFYNIYLGIAVQEFEIPGIFKVKYKTSDATPPAQNKENDRNGKGLEPIPKPPVTPITARNTSEYIGLHPTYGRDWWKWTIYIEADPGTLSQIECVEYTLHPTFPDPIQRVCTSYNNFAFSSNGWGTFEVKIRAIFKNGTERYLSHMLEFH